MNSIKRWNKSIWTGIVFGSVSVAYLVGSFGIKTATKRFGVFDASFMPKIYGIVLLLCAAVQLYSGIMQYRRATDHEETPIFSETEKKQRRLNTRNVCIGFALIFLYILLMKTLGFILSSVLFLFCLCHLLIPQGIKKDKKVHLTVIAISVLTPILSYLFFKNIVFMALPKGMLFKNLF